MLGENLIDGLDSDFLQPWLFQWTLSWPVDEKVSKIEAITSGPVRLAADEANAVVTMFGPEIPECAVYGTIAVDTEDATKVTIKPKSGNETAGLAGDFTFTVAEGVLEDLACNTIDEVTVVLTVDPPQDRPVYIEETGVCYGGIQAAITDASQRNTVVVGLGKFDELLIINKSLTILGVNADNDPSTEDFIDVGSVVYGGIKITGGDVTLKGLTIKNKGILASGVTRLELSNNKTLGIGNAQEDAPAGSIIGLDVASANGSITVDKNVFSSIGVIDGTGTAIRIVKAQDSITITSNIIRGVTKNGINIYSNCLTQESAVLTITDNVIENWDSDQDQADLPDEGIGGRAIRIDFVGAVSSEKASIQENKFVPPICDGTQTPVDPQYVKLTSIGIKVDLRCNYWGSDKPNFNVILMVDGGKSSECTYLLFYKDPEMKTLIEPEAIEFNEPTVLLEVYTRPSVLHDGANYHIWYRTYGSGYELFHRTADTIEGLEITEQREFTFVEGEVPDNFSVIKGEDGHFFMFSSNSDGNKINVYQSVDGNKWTMVGTPVLEATDDTWLSTKIDNPMVVYDGIEYKMYYQGREDGYTKSA